MDNTARPDPPRRDGANPPTARPRAGRQRIPLGIPVLVAAHDDERRRVMTLVLAERGYTTHQVTDGVAALDFLRRARPPLVVVAEETLPEIGGFQLAGLLALKRAAEVRYNVVVLTTDLRAALRQSLHRKLDAVTLEVLVQPFHVGELLMAVDMASERLAGKRSASGRASG